MICSPRIRAYLPLAICAALSISSTVLAQSVTTRMGTLQLENGYPSKEAVEKIYDEMDYQRASQIFLWGLPAVGFHNLHQAHLKNFGAKDGRSFCISP